MIKKTKTNEIVEEYISLTIEDSCNQTEEEIEAGYIFSNKEWVSVESMINELEKFETDVRHHFHKVTNPKLNTIRAINHIINKLRGE